MRVETKFILGFEQYHYLRDRLAQFSARDEHVCRQGRYPVLSAYFDTPGLESFYQKVDGEYVHSKFRMRRYGVDLGEPGDCFLEAKLKFDQDQRKVRFKTKYTRQLLDPSSWYGLKEPGLDELVQWLPPEGLLHAVSVYYEREAFECVVDEQNVRMNFDTALTYLRPEETCVTQRGVEERPLLGEGEGGVILEVKTDTLYMPEVVQQLLKSADAEQTRVSKYAEALLRIDENHPCSEVSV